MTEVVVTGIGLVCALGDSFEESWKHLIAGKTAIALHEPFAELPPTPLALIGQQPVDLAMLTRLVVASALDDAGLSAPLLDCGVVIGSSRSNQVAWERLARNREWGVNSSLSASSPSLPVPWLDTLPHMNAILAARLVGATGIVLAPMAACATGIWALAQGFNLIQTGQCQRIIAGAVEAPITPLILTGFEQMGALAKTGAYPFDIQREGLVLGEGGAVFVLESAALAQQRCARVYGQILGFGLTADAYHPNAPDPTARGAIAAVKQCLHRSHINPEDIDYIHAHGTGTILNDRIESILIQKIFPHPVAVSSTKGATGHTLGASGALGAAFSLMALRQQIVPLSVGLRNPEFILNFIKTADISEIRQVMCFSFGFGGQNAVMALGKYPNAKF